MTTARTRAVRGGNNMKHYAVWTPSYQPYVGYGEPSEGQVSDYVEVSAINKRQAKVAAVREMRNLSYQWVQDQESDRASPFTGLQLEEICEHGLPVKDKEWCTECGGPGPCDVQVTRNGGMCELLKGHLEEHTGYEWDKLTQKYDLPVYGEYKE